jgi:hypothetical protein
MPKATAQACAPAVPRPDADPLSRDVGLLGSEDFVERSQAARRLVAAGEAALPVLGAAGEAFVTEPGGQRVSTTKPVLAALMRELPPRAVEQNLEAEWPVVRRAAVAELGQRRGWTSVPALVARLDDPDPAVRAEAASSLRRLTNRFFGYDARADLRVRDQAARRWREWWTIEGRVRADEGRRPGEG